MFIILHYFWQSLQVNERTKWEEHNFDRIHDVEMSYIQKRIKIFIPQSLQEETFEYYLNCYLLLNK